MNFLNLFRQQRNTSANTAKERLQIIVAHERRHQNNPNYLPKLQQELIEVIAKYVQIKQEHVQVSFQNSGDCSVLELNITIPERETSAA